MARGFPRRLGLLLAVAAGCTAPEPPLAVVWAGCQEVRAGPRCRVAAGDRLTLVVPGAEPLGQVETDVGLVPTASVTLLLDAVRVSVAVPAGARRLQVQRGDRRFVLALEPQRTHPVITEARARRAAGDLPGLRAKLAQADALPPDARAQAQGLLARARLAEGAPGPAAEDLEAAAKLAFEAGLVSEALGDLFAASWVRSVQLRDFEGAARALDQAERGLADDPAETAAVAHYRAQLALETLDLRTARAGFVQARAAADRLGDRRQAAASEEMVAVVDVEMGRPQHAVATFRALEAAAPTPCARANTANNLGWSLHAAGALVEAEAALAEATRLHAGPCPNRPGLTYARLNRALVALDAGNPDAAEAHLDAAAAGGALDSRMWLWAAEIEARVAEARAEVRRARARFGTLLDRADTIGARDAAWRARVGLARTWATRSPTTAIALLTEAEADLDALTRGAPITDGLSRFLARHDEGARLLVALLLDQGRVQTAHRVASRALHRPLLLLSGLGRRATLGPRAQKRWAQQIGRYAVLQTRAAAAAARKWQVPQNLTQAAAQAELSMQEDLRGALEAALLALPRAPDLSTPEPGPGEALVTVFPLGPDRAVFVRARGHTRAQRVPRGHLAQALVQIPERRWRIDAVEPLDVPAGVEAAYVLQLGGVREAPPGARAALVVGNPTGDLEGAAEEARAVANRLRARGHAVTLLVSAQATRAAVLAALPRVETFHYAGHARHAGPDGWRSALPLADLPLELGDLFTLPRTPARVVLSGCEAGKVGAGQSHTLGLAQGFLVAGSEIVVAPTVPVPDAHTPALMEALYGQLERGSTPEGALLALRARGPEDLRALVSAFRVFRALRVD